MVLAKKITPRGKNAEGVIKYLKIVFDGLMIATQLSRLIIQENCKYAIAYQKGNEVFYPHEPTPLTEEKLGALIANKTTIGVMLANPEGLVKSGCIDLDSPRDGATLDEVYQLALKLCEAANTLSIKAYIEYSGSKGYHVWVFSYTPIYWATMRDCLTKICEVANYKPAELFSERHPESKVIKLPGCKHLKSGNLSGFIEPTLYTPLEPTLLPKQDDFMATIQQTPIEAILGAVETSKNITPLQKQDYDFSRLGGKPPSCINHLVTNGANTTQDYNHSNLTVARYAIAISLPDQGVGLATQMAKNSDHHPTSKTTIEAKVSNYKSAIKAAINNPTNYKWSCSYVVGARADNQPLSSVGCIGDQCPLFVSTKQPLTHTHKPKIAYNPVIVKALNNLIEKGTAIGLSSILVECESLIVSGFTPTPQEATEGEQLQEKEVIQGLIKKPEYFPSEGFISGIHTSLKEYLEELFNSYTQANKDVISKLRNKGLKAIAQNSLSKIDWSSQSVEPPLDEIEGVTRTIRGKTSDQGYMADYQQELTDEIFLSDRLKIPTPSEHLDYFLNGGLAPGKLFISAGIPGSGKSTWAAQLGDYVASQKIPVLYAAYEMSRSQLFLYSMSRICKCNSNVIEQKAWLRNTDKLPMKKLLIKESFKYHQTIGKYLKIIEADDAYTISKLKSLIIKTRQELNLNKTHPILVIVDYLQLMLCGDEKIDSSTNETLRVSRIATQCKRLAREENCIVWAISDITKAAYEKAVVTGSLDLSALRDSFKIAHAADTILLQMANTVDKPIPKKQEVRDTGNPSNTSTSKLDQIDLYFKGKDEDEKDINLKANNPLKKETCDTYARFSLLKNRGGMIGDCVFVYKKAIHTFVSIQINKLGTNHEEII